MIWNLLFAHFLGDFLLQSDWIARKKTNFWVLTLHVGTILVLMLLLVGASWWIMWPYLLLIATTHIVQDRGKILLTKWKQRARVPFFFLDQLLHVVIIWAVVAWFNLQHPGLPAADKPAWVIIALVFLLVTNVWFITERVIYADDVEYVGSLNQTKNARMLSRAVLTSLLFLLRLWVFPGMALFLQSPYPLSPHRLRALLTDLCVSVFGVLFLILALG